MGRQNLLTGLRMSDRDPSLEGVHPFPNFRDSRICHHLNRPPAWLVHLLSLAGSVNIFLRHANS